MPLTTARCDTCGHTEEIRFSGSAEAACKSRIHCGNPMHNVWNINFDCYNGPYFLSSDMKKPYGTKMAATEAMKRAGYGAIGS